MPRYKIPVFWSYGGTVEVEANSMTEAIVKAQEDNSPINVNDACYIDGSFTVDVYQANDELEEALIILEPLPGESNHDDGQT